MSITELKEMPLHSTIRTNPTAPCYEITRVPNGWLYVLIGAYSDGREVIGGSTFVPDNI